MTATLVTDGEVIGPEGLAELVEYMMLGRNASVTVHGVPKQDVTELMSDGKLETASTIALREGRAIALREGRRTEEERMDRRKR